MRILLLPSWYPTPGDPVSGVFVRDQVEVLSTIHEVSVLRPLARGDSAPQFPEVTVERIRTAVPGVASALRAYRVATLRGIRRIARSVGAPALIHAHVSLPAGWAAVEAGRELGIPVVLTEHLSPFDPARTAPRHQAKIRSTLVDCAAVIAVSPHLSHEVARFTPQVDVDVLGDVVRDDLFTPGPDDGPPGSPARLFAAGGLTPQKGFDVLLAAARLLVDRGSAFELAIAGEGPERARLEGLAEGLPVELLGTISRAEMRDRMREARAVVSSSLHESFGLVLVEAMACGKRVIATRCGGPEFTVPTEAGILVDPGSAEALADAMEAVIKEGTARDGPGIRDDVTARFGRSAFLEGLGRIYDRVLGGS